MKLPAVRYARLLDVVAPEMRRTLFALLVTLAGCPSDPLADEGGESGSTGTSTGSPLTTLGDTTVAGTDGTDSGTADSGTTGSTTGPGTTDTGTSDTGTSDSGASDSSTGDSSTSTSSTGDASTSGSSTSTSESGTSDSGTSEGSSTDGTTTGDEAIGFQQCDSPDDCLPGEGCLNDNIDDPTVAVCFFEDCATADDCPAVPAGGDSEAFCVDVTEDGLDDCVIVCSSSVCPTSMACFLDSICVWPLE